MLRLVVATSLLVLVAGCADPEPEEPKPTPSATPTVTAPTMPAQAKENTPEGAAAFVDHYIDIFNFAARTGDVSELTALSALKCTPCRSYADEFRDIYSRGDRISQQLWTLKAMDVDTDGQQYRVTARVNVNEGAKSTNYRLVFLLPAPKPEEVLSIKIVADR